MENSTLRLKNQLKIHSKTESIVFFPNKHEIGLSVSTIEVVDGMKGAPRPPMRV